MSLDNPYALDKAERTPLMAVVAASAATIGAGVLMPGAAFADAPPSGTYAVNLWDWDAQRGAPPVKGTIVIDNETGAASAENGQWTGSVTTEPDPSGLRATITGVRLVTETAAGQEVARFWGDKGADQNGQPTFNGGYQHVLPDGTDLRGAFGSVRVE